MKDVGWNLNLTLGFWIFLEEFKKFSLDTKFDP